MGVVSAIVFLLRALLGDRAAIAAENLALRQQLAVLQVSVKRPRLRKRDRIFWVWLFGMHREGWQTSVPPRSSRRLKGRRTTELFGVRRRTSPRLEPPAGSKLSTQQLRRADDLKSVAACCRSRSSGALRMSRRAAAR